MYNNIVSLNDQFLIQSINILIYIQKNVECLQDCNGDGRLSCDDYVRLHYFGEANCERPISSLPYYKVFRSCIVS